MLGSVTRILVSSAQLRDGQLQTLLVGAGLDDDPVATDEVRRWARLLTALRDEPTEEQRRATAEALMLRGLPEATVLLAVAKLTEPAPIATQAPEQPATRRLIVSTTSLDLGSLPMGHRATGDFEVEGDSGYIVLESDQLEVSPLEFGPDRTQISVAAKPVTGGLLWTTLKLVTRSETLEVPVLAQWVGSPTASYSSGQTSTSPTQITCADCGLTNTIDEIYCQHCTAQLQQSISCRYCKHSTPANARYCVSCGQGL